ncbi:asparagine synthase (glutamine-hydrolyzing) [Methanobacterium sp. 42_16]|uniref:Putative asparagine synthetase [glutamine-hydrolyzing] n=2 Tax=Methanobacterium formicicum TaxID=2162 RepID=A0A090JT99_METFO|nr:asparagine synthase (glutamine-hydrolyzing) [Methanobacterium sp. 42_16]KUK73152.1 MAG: Asparagine synthetase [Methanobacterium sp. 42_16]CEA12631.1 asparagine synthase [Methanobacterium formicicum]
MSAITAIFYRTGKNIEPEIIDQMTTKLSHRGPDDSGVWCEGPMGLGHQMLWTTPESVNEKLPFFEEDTGLVITADARIDNRNELSKLLGVEDHDNIPDTYFILRAYEKWKEKCPEYLLGDFAFVIWDPNDETLFCARDHMGVKPFYYYLSDNLFVCASELKAFFDIPQIKLKLNEEKIGLFLMEIEDNKSTFYKNIYSLTPAHSVIITKDQNKFRKYWELDPDLEISLNSEDEYIATFLKIFEESINCRLRSEFSIGFDLSGGLDSSSIVCMVKHLITKQAIKLKKINTFSFVSSKSKNNSEYNYIKKVTNMDNIVPNFIPNDTIGLLKDFKTILDYQDQPFYSPFLVNMWNLCKKIHENEVRIQLRGTGGDAVISYGTFYFRELAVNFKWIKLMNEIRNYSKITKSNSFQIILDIIFSLIPDKIKNLGTSNKERRPGTTILEKEFAKKIDAEQILNRLFWEPVSEANSYKKYHHFIINRFSDLYELEEMDNIFAKHNIEPRYPFLDKRLIEFCYSLPTDMKVKFGWSRYILRIAMDGILPQEIQWRPFKAEANNIYQNNFLINEKKEIERIINEKSEIIANYVNLEKIQTIQKKFNQGIYNNNLLYIWLVTQLSLWLQYIKLDDEY